MNGYALYLMRHGVPDGAGRMLGHTDSAPLKVGVDACVVKGEALGVTNVVSSDLLRARVPADRIAERTGAELRIDSDWRELDFGSWDNMHVNSIDVATLAAFWSNPDSSPPPGGERWSALCARVAQALGRIDRPTLVVAHAGSIRAALCQLCGFDYRQCWTIDLPYGALLSLEVHAGAAGGARIAALQP